MNGTRKAVVAACFAACCASVGVLSGTVTPVAYGVGEATTGVTATGIVSTITALLSAGGGLFALLTNTAVTDFARGALGNITQRDLTGAVLDAAFVTIAAAILSRKGTIEPTMLAELGALRKKIEDSATMK